MASDSTPQPRSPGETHSSPPTQDYWVAVCTPEHTASDDDIAEMLPTHLQWVRSVEDSGQLFLAGPLLSGPGVRRGSGIMIFRADDESAALDIANQDPFKTSGLRTFVLYHWQPNEGSLSLRLTLSNRSYDWR